MQGEEKLLQQLLLGTNRRQQLDEAVLDDLATAQWQPKAAFPEEKLLETLSVYHFINKTAPQHAPETVELNKAIAPDDMWSVCAKVTGDLLADFLQRGEEELIAETLQLLQHHQARVPAYLLVRLFEYANVYKNLMDYALPVIDERGKWLARQNSKWRVWIVEEKDEELFYHGSREERVRYMNALRRDNPSAARTLLMACWDGETMAMRRDFLKTCWVNLAIEDKPLLEKAAKDKKLEVRAEAYPLLATFEDSEWSQRIQTILRSCFTKNKRAIQLPELTAELKYAGLKRNCNEWMNGKVNEFVLAQLIAQVPLDFWFSVEYIDKHTTPQSWVEVLRGHPAERAFWWGWLSAAQREQNSAWVRAIYNQHWHYEQFSREGEGVFWSNIEKHFDFDALNTADFNAILRQWTHSKEGLNYISDDQPIVDFLHQCSLHPIEDDVAEVILNAFKQTISNDEGYGSFWSSRSLLTKLAYRISPYLADKYGESWWIIEARGWYTWRKAVEDFKSIMRQRFALHESFK